MRSDPLAERAKKLYNICFTPKELKIVSDILEIVMYRLQPDEMEGADFYKKDADPNLIKGYDTCVLQMRQEQADVISQLEKVGLPINFFKR